MMETADVFTFCRRDLQSTSFAAFEEMRRKGQFCDLIIKIKNQPIMAHRIIVAAGIQYFQSAFDLTNSESEEKEIALHDDLDPRALESLILFAYTSKVDITAENVRSLLVTAQFLGLDQICDSCIDFLSKRLNIQNVGHVHELAVSLRNARLLEKCNSYIVKNFEDFSKTPEFLRFSSECVKEILSDNDLAVPTEEVVFEAILEWVKFSPSERQIAFPKLLTEVRMIYLPVPYLMKQVDTEELIINSKSCRDLVNKVKYYHLMPELTAEFVNLKSRPRKCFMCNLYTVCLGEVPDSNCDSRQLFVFTLVNSKWLAISAVDLLSSVHRVVGVNGKMYIFLDKTILIFHTGSQQWEWLNPVHECIQGAAIVRHDAVIHCFGSAGSRFRNKIRIFDTQSNTWSEVKEMKTERRNAAAASLGQFVYVTGGFKWLTTTDVVEKYSPSEDQWTDVAPMLFKRDTHCCTVMEGKIYVCGGTVLEHLTLNFLNAAEVYDPNMNQWKYISSMQHVKNVVCLVPHCGKIYAFGKRDVEVYDPEMDEWKSRLFVSMELQGALATSSI